MFRKLASFLFAASLVLLAEPIVKNGFFDERPPEKDVMPPSWTMEKPAAGGWAFEDADGIDSPTSIRFTSTEGAGALTQLITLKPNTDYALLFWYKSDGGKPAVFVNDSAGKVIAVFDAADGKRAEWQSAKLCFRSGASADNVLALAGNGDGKIFYDSVEILTRTEADKRQLAAVSSSNLVNIALNKKYTMAKEPDYPFCKDADDAIQLTDGVYTKGYFWTQKSTVGWYRNKPVAIIVDLGKTEPIGGASWSCAACTAGTTGVQWPSSIWLFASEDRENWQPLGDLTYLGVRGKKAPDSSKYSNYTYSTGEFRAKGRYVAFFATVASGAIFCDEVEVYGGNEEFLKLPDNYTVSAKQARSRNSHDFH